MCEKNTRFYYRTRKEMQEGDTDRRPPVGRKGLKQFKENWMQINEDTQG